MSTAFSIARNIFALIGLAGCVLVGVLFAFNAAEYWVSRKRERHLDQVERAEAARHDYLQQAVNDASDRQPNGGNR